MNIRRAIDECLYVFAVTVHDFFFKPELFSIFSCDFRSSECASFEKTVLFGSLGLPLAPLGYLRFPSWQRCTTMFNWHKATISKSNVSQSQKNDFKLNFWLKFDFCLPLLNSVLIYNCFLDSLVIKFAFFEEKIHNLDFDASKNANRSRRRRKIAVTIHLFWGTRSPYFANKRKY